MKDLIFKGGTLNEVMLADLRDYMQRPGEVIGKGITRLYMGHRNQSGYTKISQTKTQIQVRWVQ